MDDFIFTLSEPLMIHSKGEQVSAFTISCKAPSVKCKPTMIKMKQTFYKSINDLTKSLAKSTASPSGAETPEKKDAVINPSEVLSILYMGDIDMIEFQQLFKDLVMRSGISAEGENLNSMHIDSMSLEDYEGLMSGYIAFFLVPSWMRQIS